MANRLLPTGRCWCGCGAETGVGSFFRAGHDKVAESMAMLVKYGGVPEFLAAHGYAAGVGLRNAYDERKVSGGTAR